MKVITVLIVGQIHRDPAPIELINNSLDKFKAAHVPVVYCAPENCEQTLEVSISNVQACIQETQMLLSFNPVKDQLKRDPQHKKPYFLIEQFKEVGHAIARCKPNLHKNVLETLRMRALCLNSYPANLELLRKIQNTNVPYFAIDLPIVEKMDLINARGNSTYDESLDTKHLKFMAQRLFQTAIPTLTETGGVIIVSAGILEAHRIAAYFMQHLKQNPLEGIQVVPVPIYLFSPYSIDARPGQANAIASLKRTESVEVQQLFETMNLNEMVASESADGQFHSAEFDKLIRFAIEAHQKVPHTIYIPDMDENKMCVLLTLGVILKDHSENPTPVCISSVWLLKASRTLLGVNKLQITLADHVEERTRYLTQLPHVSVEATAETDVVHVTFPIRFFDSVQKAAEPWEKFADTIQIARPSGQ